jgi:tetratricopeptide (TPR) repeat protein
MSLTVHKKRFVNIIPLQEEQGFLLNNNEEASHSTNSLEETNNLSNSTTKQLENIERENRLSAILRLHTNREIYQVKILVILSDALANFKGYMKGVLAETSVKNRLEEIGDNAIKSYQEGAHDSTLNNISRSVSFSSLSPLSTYGIGIGIGMLGAFLATHKNKSSVARGIARILGTNVDALNVDIVLTKLKDEKFFNRIQTAVVSVMASHSIDKFAEELELSKGEAWHIYSAVKDLILDREVINILLSTSNRLDQFHDRILAEMEVFKSELSDQIRYEFDAINQNFQRILTQRSISEAGVRLYTNLTEYRQPNKNCWYDGYLTEADIKEGYDYRRPVTDDILTSLDNNRGIMIFGDGYFGKSTLVKRIIIEEIDRGLSVLLLEDKNINSRILVELNSEIVHCCNISDLLIICDDVHTYGNGDAFKAFNEMTRPKFRNTKFIFTARKNEFKQFKDALNSRNEICEVEIALRNIKIFDLDFSQADANKFMIKAIEVSSEGLPSNEQEIKRVSSSLYESSRRDPLTFFCFLVAYLRDRKSLDMRAYEECVKKDLIEKKIRLDHKQNLWKPAVYTCILRVLSYKLIQSTLEKCGVYERDLLSLMNIGFLIKNEEYGVRHETWAASFLEFLYLTYHNENFESFDHEYKMSTFLNCFFAQLNAEEIIIVLKNCSLLAAEQNKKPIAKAIVKCLKTPEYVTGIDLVNLNSFGLAYFYASVKEYDTSLRFYVEALKIEPNHVPSLVNKGGVLIQLDRINDAINCYKKALEIEPRRVEALYNMGNALLALKEFDKSIKYYDDVLKVEPNYSMSFMNKGIALSHLGKYAEGLMHINRAIELDPNNERALLNKGITLILMGEYNDALASIEESLKLNDKEPISWYYKAHALVKKRDFANALVYYDKCLTIDPNFENAKSEKAALLKGGGTW